MSITLRVVLACRRHKTYRGLRPPKVKCETCEAIYAARNKTSEFTESLFDDDIAHIQVIDDGQDGLLQR
jgi:hypothetical protein